MTKSAQTAPATKTREDVVVAKVYFVAFCTHKFIDDGYIVFVNDWHDADFKQQSQHVARVHVGGSVGEVFCCEQNLSNFKSYFLKSSRYFAIKTL